MYSVMILSVVFTEMKIRKERYLKYSGYIHQ